MKKRKTNPMMRQQKITSAEVGRRLGLSRQTIINWINLGKIKAINAATSVGPDKRPRYLIDEEELVDLKKRQQKQILIDLEKRRGKFTMKELCKRWGLSRQTILKLIHSGELEANNVMISVFPNQTRWLVDIKAVTDFEKRHYNSYILEDRK